MTTRLVTPQGSRRICCSWSYWVSMALIAIIFGVRITGGADSSVPGNALLYHFAINMSSAMAEIWVASNMQLGFLPVRNCFETIGKALRGERREMVTIETTALSLVGRYDTFSDVVFCAILCKMEPFM